MRSLKSFAGQHAGHNDPQAFVNVRTHSPPGVSDSYSLHPRNVVFKRKGAVVGQRGHVLADADNGWRGRPLQDGVFWEAIENLSLARARLQHLRVH